MSGDSLPDEIANDASSVELSNADLEIHIYMMSDERDAAIAGESSSGMLIN